MGTNLNLRIARNTRNDEFYTRYEDIRKAVVCYREYFKGKTILCPCDKPWASNFYSFFTKEENFHFLGLKKVTACFYSGGDNSSFATHYIGRGNTYSENLTGDGDLRSEEVRSLIKKADIIVTNPPFSLLTKFLLLLMEEKKDFLIVGNYNCLLTSELFTYLKNEKVWVGGPPIMDFDTPNKEVRHFGNTRWLTNLGPVAPRKALFCTKSFSEKKYPTYDNCMAVNVDKVADIPKDYFGVMGVPISFLDYFDPAQFEVVAMTRGAGLFPQTKKYTGVLKHSHGISENKHIAVNQSATLLHEEKPNKTYYTADGVTGFLTIPFVRLLIRRKQC